MIEIKRKDGSVLRTIDADSLRGAYLRDANLRDANLRGAYLQDAYLQGADLRYADLRGAYLQGAYLQGADLRDADLRGAYLRGAYLQDAYLQGADLRDADLRGAYLQDADLQDADLTQCKQYVAVIQASRHNIVAIDDDIGIGCQRMTLAMWLEQFEVVGRAAGYTEQQIAEYGIYLRAIRDVLEVRKKWLRVQETHETTDR
jgi:hypothetical protein